MQEEPSIDYKARLQEAHGTITVLKHRIEQLEKMIFGSKHERFVPTTPPAGQLTLELQADATHEVNVTSTQKIAYTRSKTTLEPKSTEHPGRNPLPDHLRRVEIVLEPEGVPEGSIRIGELISEQLEATPSELYVKRFIRPKYALPKSSGEEDGTKILTASLPVQPIDKCMAGPSLLAQILIDKYMDHLPAHRQMQRFERSGVSLPYSTIISWIGSSCKLLQVFEEALKQEVLSTGYLHADETGIKVLDEQKNGKKVHHGFFWVYHTTVKKLVYFDYQKSRNRTAAQSILSTYKGYLQTDGYEVYDDFDEEEQIHHLLCMAHARRYFVDSLNTDKNRAEYALGQMQRLYAIERRSRDEGLSVEEKKAVRQKEAVPILDQLGKWMKEQLGEVLPKSPIGKALAYSVKRWEKLGVYTQDGRLSIDNNAVENSIRPVALGRKNYLFCGSGEAARRAAMIYSLLGSCKLHGINPLVWLTDVLTRLPMQPINQIKELLPHNWKPLQD
ncbi:IS66 family transposase [Chitinophagaceae bacterium LB-8]|uniref:IS66 family transposase n=1 Tax=Paraflavisolibacter caeni TaxID=2982496 RepID=A0A9X2XQ46_9BACT|nr:IS66 family transposase [Paraflavisolibacter caeni]MCU7552943.1 IS66 family transposase [Paraflavisolibacter caeni]